MHITHDGSTSVDNLHTYVNGVESTFGTYVAGSYGGTTQSTSQEFKIGASHWGGGVYGFFNGHIDEIRISDIERSSSWISTTYNTINDPSNFMSIGPEESAP